MLATTLVLIAALMHAVWNGLIKASNDRVVAIAGVDITAIILIFPFVLLVPFPSLDLWIIILSSVAINLLYRVCLLKAYSYGDFGQIYPITRGISPLIVSILSVFFLNEKLHMLTFLGVFILCLGIIILVEKKQNHDKRGLYYALITGSTIACYTLVDASGARSAESVYQYIVYMNLCLSVSVVSSVTYIKGGTILKSVFSNYKLAFIGGISYILSYGLILYAMTLENVGKVSALRESSVILAALIGTIYFHEPFGQKRILAAIFVAIGIIIIKIGP